MADNNKRSARYSQFAEWLTKRQNPKFASDIFMALIEAEVFLRSQNKIDRSIYEMSSEKIYGLLQRIRENRAFRFKTSLSMQVHQKAAIELKNFLLEKEKEAALDLESSHTEIPNKASVVKYDEMQSASNENKENIDILDFIKESGIRYIDNRPFSGALWILGDDKLRPFVDKCKQYGYLFKYKPEGGKSSGGQPCWWLNHPQNKIEEKSQIDSSEITFESLLSDGQYDILRNTLLKLGINTLESLKKINLWTFMNTHSLYTIQQRLIISNELNEKLSASEPAVVDATEKCVIQYGDTIYSGETPSKAFLQFVIDVAKKYPLKFRNLISLINPETQKVVIRKHDYNGDKLKLINPEAYIDPDLSVEQLNAYIPWIAKKCSFPVQSFEIRTIEMMEDKIEDTPTTYDSKPNNENATLSEPLVSYNAGKNITKETEPSVSEQEHIRFPDPAPAETQMAEKYILKADLEGVTYSQLQDYLSTTMVATRDAVALSPKLLLLNSKLYHEDSFVDFEEGADQLEAILEKLLQKNNGLASLTQLATYARSEMSMFLNDNDITESQAIFDLARHLFEKVDYHNKHYVFKSNMYISLPEVSADSNNGIIQRYAREKGTTVTFDEITKYLDGLGLNSGNLRGIMRINSEPIFLVYQENEYLLSELMHMDDNFFSRMSTALRHLFEDVGDHIIIRAIQDSWYALLPALPAGLEWTPMLLQQLVDFYPKRLGARTIIAMDSQSSNALHAMLVEKDSLIQDFRDVVAVYLHEEYRNRTKYEAEELRHLLVESGMISGNQLIYNMHKALGKDQRFIWDSDNANVTVRL